MMESGNRETRDRMLNGIMKFSSSHDSELNCVAALVDAEAKTALPCTGRCAPRKTTSTVNAADRGFVIIDSRTLRNGRFLVSRYDEAHLPSEWHKPIMTRTAERGWVFRVRLDHEGTTGFREMLNVLGYNSEMGVRPLSSIHNAALWVRSSVSKPKPGGRFQHSRSWLEAGKGTLVTWEGVLGGE